MKETGRSVVKMNRVGLCYGCGESQAPLTEMAKLDYSNGKKEISVFFCRTCFEYKRRYLAEADFFSIRKGGDEYSKWENIKKELDNTEENFEVA